MENHGTEKWEMNICIIHTWNIHTSDHWIQRLLHGEHHTSDLDS